MLYHYLAADKSGIIVEDDYDADNLDQVLRYLAGKELRPVDIKALKTAGKRSIGGGISTTDKVFLTKYLSLMLKVGTDLLSAVNILIADFEKPAVRNFLLEVRDNLSHGKPFYQAFAEYPKVFSQVFVSLIRAAEASGNLQQTFEDLSNSLEREAALRSRIRSALVYPTVLLSASLLVFFFLVTFALPKIAASFLDSGVKPPLFSRIVFSVGLYVGGNIAVIGPGLIVLIVLLVIFFRSRPGRKILDRMLSHLPILRKVYREIALQRFAATFSSLMKAGLPIINAMKITSEVVGSEEFKVSLVRIADEGLAKGRTIGEAFRRETVFPKVVTNLIAISEKAGHLEEVLGTLSEFYEANVDASIKTLVSFLEPILLMIMGLLVATIALAIIVPIYQLTTQF